MVTKLDKNTKEINGPVNVVRLEGDVNGIKKIIYLFMDYHMNVASQTTCENIFAKDVQVYFAESFDNLSKNNKIYDFFLEIFPTQVQNIAKGYSFPAQINYKEIYIAELMKFFRKVFGYNPSENKVSVSNYFKNVRFHYMDVRDYFERKYFGEMQRAWYMADNMWKSGFVDLYLLGQLINIVDDLSEDLQKIINIFATAIKSYKKTGRVSVMAFKDLSKQNDPESQPSAKEQEKMDKEYMEYLLHKMFSRYSKQAIGEKLVKYIDVIIGNLKELISICENIKNRFSEIGNYVHGTPSWVLTKWKKYAEHYDYGIDPITFREMLTYIFSEISILQYKYIIFFTSFMDIYFLRRFLDKDYITNAIAYTGAAHSDIYIKILVQDFGFKITHFNYSKISDLDELNREILKKRDHNELGELFYPPVFNQCSDMAHFPENFN